MTISIDTIGPKSRLINSFAKEWIKGNIHSRRSAYELARQIIAAQDSRYVVFLVPGLDEVNGGLMSIFSIAKESARHFEGQSVQVSICTALRNPPLRRYTKFDNDAKLFPFRCLIDSIRSDASVMVHAPEVAVQSMLLNKWSFYQRDNIDWRFNILLQNIDLIPSYACVARLKELGKVTATIAHAAYANEQTAARLGCPVHFLSTWICPEAFRRTDFEEKDRLIVVSPDAHPLKRELIQRFAQKFPDHKVIEIRKMTYRQYRETTQRAKFSFSFGEGLDGYFGELIFSGGIGMTIYNDRFFTPDYEGLDGVFRNPERDLNCITDFMASANNPQSYREIAGRQFAMLSKKYVRAEYLENIRSFYAKFFPK
jgi:hypothetical protein